MAAPFPPVLDPDRSNIINIIGSKGSGKSAHARLIYVSYPYDKLVIDPTGDAEPGPGAEVLTPPFPARFPRSDDGRPRNLHCKVNMSSPTYKDDMDRAVAMGLFPQDLPTMVWVDEAGLIMRANFTPPHVLLALMSSRHYGPMSMMLCGPRSKHLNPLSISQADRIVLYDMPNVKDVELLAENMGFSAPVLRRAVHVTQDRNAAEREAGGTPFWHLVYDRAAKHIWRMPPVPLVAHRGPRA